MERLTHARDAEMKYLKEQNELEIEKSKEMSEIETNKFKNMVDAIGAQTLLAMATAGPDLQVRGSMSYGLSRSINYLSIYTYLFNLQFLTNVIC